MISNSYSASNKPLSKEDVEKRVLEIVKSYDKIVAEKVFHPKTDD